MFLLLFKILAIVSVVVQSGPLQEETVQVSLYYEALCPYCQSYYSEILDVVTKLGPRVELNTYPYGNARTTTENGKTVITCQHGPPECHLNQVHACAIDVLKDVPKYVQFNNCIMKQQNVKQCGQMLNIETQDIEKCSNGDRGFELLKYYGEKTAKVHFRGVPFVQVNLCQVDSFEKGELLKEVCAQFRKGKPEACQ